MSRNQLQNCTPPAHHISDVVSSFDLCQSLSHLVQSSESRGHVLTMKNHNTHFTIWLYIKGLGAFGINGFTQIMRRQQLHNLEPI